MIYDLTKKLLTFKGKSIKNPSDEELDVSDICLDLLTTPDLKEIPGKEKITRYKLAKKIFNSPGSIELTTEEAALLLKLAESSTYNHQIIGQVHEAIEGNGKPALKTVADPAKT